MLVNAAGRAAEEAVRDVALGALAVAGTAAVAAAEVVSVAAGTAANAVSAAAGTAKAGVSAAAKAVGKGIDKTGTFIHKVKEPLELRKIEKLSAACSELLLFKVNRASKELSVGIYTSALDLLMNVFWFNGHYVLRGADGSFIATFTKQRKLFINQIIINTVDGFSHEFSGKASSEDKTKYQMDNKYKLVKVGMSGDLDIYFANKKTASLRSKPISDVDYALQVYDEITDLESVLVSVARILL